MTATFVLHRNGGGNLHIPFDGLDGQRFFLPIRTWEELAHPEIITILIEPGGEIEQPTPIVESKGDQFTTTETSGLAGK